MQRIKLLGLALIALVAFGAIASASAFAEGPEITPTPTAEKPLSFTAKGGEATLQGTSSANQVKCLENETAGKFTTQDKGTGTVKFIDCRSELGKCTSTGQSSGVILTEGEVQLVDVLPTSTLDLGLLIKPHADSPKQTEYLSFVCGGTATIIILGSVIGVFDTSTGSLLTSPSSFTSATEYKVLFKQSAQGKQEILTCMLLKATCLNSEGKEINFHLESDFGLGHELAAEIADGVLKFGASGTLTF
jgi:hypothetical protein